MKQNAFRLEKKAGKLSLFADCMIRYVEIPKKYSKKILYLRNKLNTTVNYKINIQMFFVCLYSTNKQSNNEINDTHFQ